MASEEVKLFTVDDNLKSLYKKCRSDREVTNFYLSIFSNCEKVEKDEGLEWLLVADLNRIKEDSIVFAKVSFDKDVIFKLGKISKKTIQEISTLQVYTNLLFPMIYLGLEKTDVKHRSIERLAKDCDNLFEEFMEFEKISPSKDKRSILFLNLLNISRELLRRSDQPK